MATPKSRNELSSSWTEITSAANTAGITWQNVGSQTVMIAFTASEPTASDPYHVLYPMAAFYDKNGSAKCWARTPGGNSILMATAD